MTRPRLAFISTGLGIVGTLERALQQVAPEVDALHIIDDSVVRDMASAGDALTPEILRRLTMHVLSAEMAGANVILVTCSSISEAADRIRPFARVPLLPIDGPMARQAVATGSRIGVIGTLPTTAAPTRRMITRAAQETGKSVQVEVVICDGAFEALSRGDLSAHDEAVRHAVEGIQDRVDVVVLAQVSTARAKDGITNCPVPILTSPESGVKAAVDRLRSMQSEGESDR